MGSRDGFGQPRRRLIGGLAFIVGSDSEKDGAEGRAIVDWSWSEVDVVMEAANVVLVDRDEEDSAQTRRRTMPGRRF